MIDEARKKAFLHRVAEANAKGRGKVPAPRIAPEAMVQHDRYQGADREDVLRRLEEMAVVRDYRFHRIQKDALGDTLAAIIESEGAQRVICPRDGEAAEWALPTLLAERAPSLTLWHKELSPEEVLATVAPADLGVSVAHYAVAHVGTVVEWASPDCGKLVSLLPHTHISIIPASRVLPSLTELAAIYDELYTKDEWPSGIVHVAGPSSTGDIECIIVTGAHGPVCEHYILVEDA